VRKPIHKNSITVFAPATSANLAVGFDVLGVSLGDRFIGDYVTVKKTTSSKIHIVSVKGVVTNIPKDVKKNSATAGLIQLQKDYKIKNGFEIHIFKNIPLGSGLGGSAASAVGAVVAVNHLMNLKLSKEELLYYCLLGESVASGGMHADNVAPCLFGGLVACIQRPTDPFKKKNNPGIFKKKFHKTNSKKRSPSNDCPFEIISLPMPKNIWSVMIHPGIKIETKQARKILKPDINLKDFSKQSAFLTATICGLFKNDNQLLEKYMKDIVIEPQRKKLIPYFSEVQQIAYQNQALSCSISGSGPSIFVWVKGRKQSLVIQKLIHNFFNSKKMNIKSWIVPLAGNGAKICSQDFKI